MGSVTIQGPFGGFGSTTVSRQFSSSLLAQTLGMPRAEAPLAGTWWL
jgi:hypothetical protein